MGSETHDVRSDADVVRIRQLVRAACVELGFGLVDQTKVVTAASEIARNTLEYGGGGTLRIDPLSEGARKGLRLVFEDRGPGIADIARALQDGHTTGKGLGLGLGGARRLVSELAIESEVGKGTRVTLLKWR